jgi:type II secretory pathway pseudopilin PulG
MKVKTKSNEHKAFTIVELLTVMSIIIILIGLLVPALSQVKRYAKEVKQHAQFHSIDVAMELYETEHGGYPPSDELGADDQPYCGAMKLAEAMVGQDLLGFHMDSLYRSDLEDDNGNLLYQLPGGPPPPPENLQARKGPYLGIENANATRIENIYDANSLNIFASSMGKRFVLCDEYTRRMETAEKTGMPILYYRANLSGTRHPTPDPPVGNGYPADHDDNIYDFKDNDDLVEEGVPWNSALTHPMEGAAGAREKFCWPIWNSDIPLYDGRPFKSDSYILLSAGYDGLYGTRDDIYNFKK